jgi:hypothetical protein
LAKDGKEASAGKLYGLKPCKGKKQMLDSCVLIPDLKKDADECQIFCGQRKGA